MPRRLRLLVALSGLLTLATLGPASADTGGLSWVSRASMPTARWGLAAATDPATGGIYAVGGYNNFIGTLDTVEEYSPATDTWRSRASLSVHRSQPGVTTGADGKIYAIGGASDTIFAQGTAEAYDPATDTWHSIANMPTPRQGLVAVSATNGKIYAIGGSGIDGSFVATVEEYDPATNIWRSRASMPRPRHEPAAAAASNGSIYVFGGTSATGVDEAQVLEYVPTTDTWQVHGNMPTPRSGATAVAAPNGKIYVIGGGSAVCCPHYNEVDEYTPTSDTWSTVTPLPVGDQEPGAAVGTNGKIYVMGGTTGSCCLNSLYEGTLPPPAPDLAVSISDSPDPTTPNTDVTLTVGVTNSGTVPATNVALTVTLPTGPRLVSVTPSTACSGTATLSCALGTLAVGASTTVTVVIRPSADGVYTTQASVSSTEADANLANNSVSESTTVADASSLAQLKVGLQGQGTVTGSAGGVNCKPTCAVYFNPGTMLSLNATPDANWTFDHWDGVCQGTAPTCTLTVSSDTTVRAVFKRH